MSNDKIIIKEKPYQGLIVSALSLGCEKNRVDTEEVLGYLTERGALFTDQYSAADLILVNTCGFIEPAQQEGVNKLLALSRLKKSRNVKLVAAGCLIEVFGSDLLKNIPELDGIIGVHSYHKLDHFIKEVMANRKPILQEKPSAEYNALGPRLLTGSPHSVTIKVAEGCSNRCAYCLIPNIRGDYRGKKNDQIIEEVVRALSVGAREIVLIAQDTTAYGSSKHDNETFSELVANILKIEQRFWLRIMYTYPTRIDRDLLKIMASDNRLCRYLDLPIQHADDQILNLMGRHYDSSLLASLIDQIRSAVPGIALRTTCMVGYPGETARRYNNLLHFIKEWQFDRMGAFVFSSQEGTRAAELPGQVAKRVAARRLKKLMEQQRNIALQLNKNQVGKTLIVLIDHAISRSSKWYAGRTEFQAPKVDGQVYLYSSRPLNSGDWVRARITDAAPYSMKAKATEILAELPTE